VAYDPEGILGTMTSVVLCILGVQVCLSICLSQSLFLSAYLLVHPSLFYMSLCPSVCLYVSVCLSCDFSFVSLFNCYVFCITLSVCECINIIIAYFSPALVLLYFYA